MGVHFYTSLMGDAESPMGDAAVQGLIQKNIARGDPENYIQLLTSNPRPLTSSAPEAGRALRQVLCGPRYIFFNGISCQHFKIEPCHVTI